jgi:putative transposase
MSGTYTQLLYHLVCSTKNRKPWITPDLQERLYQYIGGIIRGERGVLYEIGGIEDHFHALIRWRPDATISNLMRDLKAHSSLWIHQSIPTHKSFAWQEGYSAFTVSKSAVPDVGAYIQGQREHHRKQTFQDELRALLRLHEIEFDEKYIWL